MRLWRSSLFIITCWHVLGFLPSAAPAIKGGSAPIITQLPATNTTPKLSTLRPGSTGTEIKTLQTQLQQLGYYSDKIDGNYSQSTQTAVVKFQSAQKLTADGVAGATTRERLQTALTKKVNLASATNAVTAKPQPQNSHRDWLWWLLMGIGGLGSVGAVVYGVKKFSKLQHGNSLNSRQIFVPPTIANLESQSPPNYYNSTDATSQDEALPVEHPARMSKVDIVEELINDLRSPDAGIRRKAIWDLSQQGDSRAVQPLMDLMLDSDSQQRSLILGALAEIGTRTLKPMNRALAISLQDESPQVRQNAIRDLTRIYDQMAQFSQMLGHALEDGDAQVQETARYALSQMNRIRGISEQKSLPDNENNKQ